MTEGASVRPSAFEVLASEYHSDQPCDCYPPDRDRPLRECAAWAMNIVGALNRGGYYLIDGED